jgi:putative membrane protein
VKEEARETAGGPLDQPSRLAFDRTYLAYERTLMAWIRTSISLITFGFSMYKFFQYSHLGEGADTQDLVGPRGFGISMISIGLFSLLLATLQHRHSMRILRGEYPQARLSLAAMVAALIALLGILALIAAILRQ